MARYLNWNAGIAFAVILATPGCGRPQHASDTAAHGKATCSLADAARQGFSGFSGLGASLKTIGTIETGAAAFRLSDYEYINPQSGHANRRVVVFSADCRYFGSYLVDEAPLRIEGKSLQFRDTGVPGSRVDFSGAKPPQEIWIDGSLSSLQP